MARSLGTYALARTLLHVLPLVLWVVLLGFPRPGNGAEPSADGSTPRLQAQRVIAFADVHGAYEQLLKLLRGLEVIDEANAWKAGTTHLVSLGDLLDRGEESRKVMDLLMQLQPQAAAAGGGLHVVLGNHELMNLTGDLRYVSAAEYAAFAPPSTAGMVRENGGDPGDLIEPASDTRPAGFEAHRAAFAPDGQYGRWLLQQPSVLIINDVAFVHAGLPPLAATMSPESMEREFKSRLNELLVLRERLERAGVIGRSVDVLDSASQLRKRLSNADASRSRDAADNAVADPEPVPAEHRTDAERFIVLANDALFSDAGVLWYRGTARCHPMLEEPVLDEVMRRWGISRVVVGHTPTLDHRVRQRFHGRAILADTGMLQTYYRGQPAGVILEDRATRVYYPETGTLAERPEDVPPLEIDGLATSEVLPILRDGHMAPSEPAARPDGSLKVTVTSGDRTVDGLFQPARGNELDSQLAAFALDQLLNLNLVAPVVARRFEGRDGALMAIWSNAIDETERSERGIGMPNWCGRGSSFNLMYALDALIDNEGRLPASMIYDPVTWRMLSAGHSRAFGRGTGFPAYLQNAPTLLPGGLAAALASLDEAAVERALGDYLSRAAQRALLKRRDRLLATWTGGG